MVRKITLLLTIGFLWSFGSYANMSVDTNNPELSDSGKIPSAQVANKPSVSAEMQAQIQEALGRQAIANSQTSSRSLTATYLGSFKTNDGPNWGDNPEVYSGVEAAALIFGGSPSDYAISTNPNTTDSSTITHTAWASTWGVLDCQEVAEDYSLDLGAPGYNDPGGDNTAVSAYVTDNCTSGNTNYVWLVDGGGGSNSFVTTWSVDASDLSISIPTFSGATYSYDVDWGDGNTSLSQTSNASHTYAAAGTYTVAISGDFPRIYFNNSGDKNKIQTIEQWGDNVWTSMDKAFMGCSNLVSNATDTPNLSMVTNMFGMFAYATEFNGDANIGNWDVSNVTNMQGMFGGASNFNANIGDWNVGNVNTMKLMFSYANHFNQDIGNWNVSNVKNMDSMFSSAASFNQDISNWNVSNVVNMSNMFSAALAFNQNIDNWNVGSVTNMATMFSGATAFNGIIGAWDVASVTNMTKMFLRATAFNQDIGAWNVSSVANMKSMFERAEQFNQNIGAWNVGNVTNMNGMFDRAFQFNQNLGGWNVGNVTDMYGMFSYAESFNGDIANWDVSNVTTMYGMFGGAHAFNSDISNWDVSNVTSMKLMFSHATLFNQDISSWDVSSVITMDSMFRSAKDFDQNLGAWNVVNVVNMKNMLKSVTLSTANYDALLNGWSGLTLKNNVNFHGGKSNYCVGETARQDIINDFGWNITDGGLDCSAGLAGRLDMNENEFSSGIMLYPNPMMNEMILANANNTKLESVAIYDLSGRLLQTIDLKRMNSERSMDVSSLSPATYLVVITAEGKQISKLMIKK